MRKVIILLVFLILSLILVILKNKQQVRIKKLEIIEMSKVFGDLKISDEKDIIRLQNDVIKIIKHEFNGDSLLNVFTILKYRKGMCFDRSILLQKIMSFNKIDVRPVYLFYNKNNSKTYFYELFRPSINSHNIFEFKYKNMWYVMATSEKIYELMILQDYINSGLEVPNSVLYIRHLNNRNGRFLSPSWMPDIY
jgi:hypothetical protein